MSTDWDRYSTPEKSRERANRPEDNGIVSLPAGGVRAINLTVEHAPESDNQAHTDVIGMKRSGGEEETRLRLKLLHIATVLIPVPAD